MYTVLITCVGGELAPELISQFKNSKKHTIKIIGVDENENAIGRYFCDLFFTVPNGNDKNYNNAIQSIVNLNDVDLVIPTSDEEAVSLSNSRDFFEKRKCTLAAVNKNTLSILADKKKTYEFLKNHGIHTPKTLIVDNYQELQRVTQMMYGELGEFVVKPINGRGGRGVFVVSKKYKEIKEFTDRREVHSDFDSFNNILRHKLKNNYPFIVMERLLEPVIDIDLLGWNGEAIRVVPRRRVNSAVPNDGHVFLNDKALFDLGEKLISIFKLSWLYDCDVMFDSEGKPCVLELNPRLSGSVSVSVAAGIPLLDDIIYLAKGENTLIPTLAIPDGIRVIPYKSLGVINL